MALSIQLQRQDQHADKCRHAQGCQDNDNVTASLEAEKRVNNSRAKHKMGNL